MCVFTEKLYLLNSGTNLLGGSEKWHLFVNGIIRVDKKDVIYGRIKVREFYFFNENV